MQWRRKDDHMKTNQGPTRRQFGALAGTALGMKVLAGCSGESETGAAQNDLQVWGGTPLENGVGDLINAFEEKYPEYSVTYTRYINDADGNLAVNTALQGGVDIDVFFSYGANNLALRATPDMATDLAPLLTSNPDLAPFLNRDEPQMALFDGDRVLALSTSREPQFVLMNISHLDQAGIEVPTNWTMEECVDVIRELSTADRYGAFMIPDTARIDLGSDYWFTDHGKSNLSHPSFESYYATAQTLIREEATFPWTQVLARNAEAYPQNYFVQETFSSWNTAPWALRYLSDPENFPHDFLVACAPVPTTPSGNWNTGSYGTYIQINQRSVRPDIAEAFVTFWLTEGSRFVPATGRLPALDLVEDDVIIDGLLGEDKKEFFDVDSFRRVLLEQQPRYHADWHFTALTEIAHTIEQQRDVCWILEKSPEAAVETMDRTVASLIQRFEGA